MKKLIVGLSAMLPLAMLTLATSSASGFEYLCGGAAILTAKNCVVNSLNLGVLILNDRGLPAEVECPAEAVTSNGSVTNATEGETTSVTFKEGGKACKPSAKALNLKEEEKANGCEEVEKVEAVGLPWKTIIEQESPSGDWWTLIITKPGYKITCKTAGLKVTDECVSEESHTPLVLVENLAETETIEGVAGILLISAFFVAAKELLEGEAEFAKCSIGGAKEGVVIGETLLWALIAEKPASLEVSGGEEAKCPVWENSRRYFGGAAGGPKVEWRANSGQFWEALLITQGEEPSATAVSWDSISAC